MKQICAHRRRFARLTVLISALALTAGILSRAADAAPGDAPMSVTATNVTHGETEFGFRLLRRLSDDHPAKNVFLSPLSISQCLTLALNGAGGQTYEDMARTLGVPGISLTALNRENKSLVSALTQADPDVQLTIANALWADRQFTFSPEFQTRCAEFYDAKTATLDFASPSAADTINAWVSQKTQDKITHLVSAGDTRGASAVLTNAVYFHGTWTTPFRANQTQDGPFYLEGGASKTLPLMSQPRQSFPYLETAQFQAASLPYGNGRASMIVVLPKDGVTLGTVLKSLDAESWGATITQFHSTSLNLTLPRFRVEYDAGLAKPLGALGMASAFAPGADFRPMGLTRGVISDVVHKAVIEVNEQGTVAAAATGTIMRSLAMPVMRPPTVFRVDHPFLCVIRDNETGAVLFAGAMYDPEALAGKAP